ncbi:MAG: hypothetical protein AAF226_04915 [Verrucomicrobiota bacterium]
MKGFRRLGKIGLLAILVTSFSSVCNATMQVPDLLIYDGTTYSIRSNPLESYLATTGGTAPTASWKSEVMSTANYRGYVATFEIREAKLFIKKVEIEVRKEPSLFAQLWAKLTKSTAHASYIKERADLSEVFMTKTSSPRFADWFTGILEIPVEDGVGYHFNPEHAHLFRIEKGNVIRDRKVEYARFNPLACREDIKRNILYDPIAAKQPWTDLRNVKGGDKKFRTRGVCYLHDSPKYKTSFALPYTPQTDRVSFEVRLAPTAKVPPKTPAFFYEWIEAEGVVQNGVFVIEDWRLLENGESAHHPDFQKPGDERTSE